MQFNPNKEFTILQFTDLHFGENGEKDFNSTQLQEKLIQLTKPDIVVITGDSVSGYAWDGFNTTFYKDCWNMWTKAMEKLKVPYAYTLGNHDDQGDYTRAQIVELDKSNNYSMIEMTKNITGATNYNIPIYSSDNKTIKSLLWLLDTNDENCEEMPDSWGCFEKDQVKWFKREINTINQTLNYLPKGLAFFHIPLPEYREMYNWEKTYDNRNEGIGCPKKNTGLFSTWVESKAIKASFCGHDHDNDYGGTYFGIEMTYGRKTGYGGYGPSYFQRGARLIILVETEEGFSYSHSVLQEYGTIQQNSNYSWKGWYNYIYRCQR